MKLTTYYYLARQYPGDPGVLCAVKLDRWQFSRDNPRYQLVSYTAAKRWVRLGKPNETALRINHNGRVARLDDKSGCVSQPAGSLL